MSRARQLADAVPSGSVLQSGDVGYFAMNTAPNGWLKANGAAVSRATYADLFSAIGTTFGAGDGSTTFNLPDMRGEFPRGWDDGRDVDSGRSFGTAQLDAFQDHDHTPEVQGGSGVGGNYQFSSGAMTTVSGSVDPFPLDSSIRLASYNGPGGGGHNRWYRTAPETRPRNVALLACIKF